VSERGGRMARGEGRRIVAAGALAALLAGALAEAQTNPVPGAPTGASGVVASDTGPGNAPTGFAGAVRVGAVYSDNIGRDDANKVHDTATEAGLQFSDYEDRPNLKSNVVADADYQYHSDRAYGSQVVGGLNGTMQFGFVPERAGWTIQDNFGQTRTNSLAADTPLNRQQVNYLSTGPDLVLPIGGTMSLTAEGRWSRATFSETPADDRQLSGVVGIADKLSGGSSLSLDVAAQRVNYDVSTPDNDYNVRSAYLQYDGKSPRTTLRMQAGYTQLHDSLGDKSRPLATFVLSHRLTLRTKLTIDAGTTFSDSAQQFRLAQTLGGVALGSTDALVGTDPLRADHASAAWSFDGARTTFQARATWQRERHEQYVTLDRDGSLGSITLTRRIRPTVTVALSGYYGRQKFSDIGTTIDDWSGEAALTWHITQLFAMVAGAGHYAGNSSVSVNSPFAYVYTENRASIRFTYGRVR